jgi:hypothetical protein
MDWLEEQLIYWKRLVRQREDEVTRARAELSQRQFPGWDDRIPDCTVQRKNLERALARLEHAREQVERIRHWQGHLPRIIDEVYRGAAHRLQRLLEGVVPVALDDLTNRLQALEVYAESSPASASTPLPVSQQSSSAQQPSTTEPAPSGVSHQGNDPVATAATTGEVI